MTDTTTHAAQSRDVFIPISPKQVLTVKTEPGLRYRLRLPGDATGNAAAPDNVIATHHGNALHLRYADGSEVTFEDFYTVCTVANQCSVNLPSDSKSGIDLTADSPIGIDLTAESSNGGAYADQGLLVYAHGSHDVLMSMAQGQGPLSSAFMALGDAPVLTYMPPESHLLPFALLVGGVGSASAIGSSGSSAAAATVSSAPSIVQGVILAGPVVSGNDLQVILYAADGTTILAQIAAVNSSGQLSFSANLGSYTGVVIAKAISTGSATDYLDEATGIAKDLGSVVLVSAGVVSAAGSTLVLNLNALTTLAVNKLGADHSAANVDSVNAAVAHSFGLSQLQTTAVIATNSGAYNASASLSEGEKYGAVLAGLSGMDKLNGGSVQSTLDSLSSQLSITGSTASLSAAGKYQIAAGAKTVTALSTNQSVVDSGSTSFGDTVATLINYSANPVSQAQGLTQISSSAGAVASTSTPTAFDYANANVTGVVSSTTLSLVNDSIKTKTANAVDTTPEVQAIADASNAVINAPAGGSAPTLAQLQLLGITGVTSDNLATIQKAIGTTAVDGTGVDTLSKLQSLVSAAANAAAALSTISTAAQTDSATATTPAVAVYTAAGVTGVTAGNLAAINSALDSAAVNGAAANTTALVQTIVNDYNAILASADGTAGNTATPLTGAQYTAIGVTGVSGTATSGTALGLLDSAVDASASTAFQTVAQVQALADAAAHVMAAAGGSPAAIATLTLADLTQHVFQVQSHIFHSGG